MQNNINKEGCEQYGQEFLILSLTDHEEYILSRIMELLRLSQV